jgi:hypothetical protein
MDAFHAWLDRHLAPALAHGVAAIFTLPGWAATGVPGTVLAFLFGRRAPDAA